MIVTVRFEYEAPFNKETDKRIKELAEAAGMEFYASGMDMPVSEVKPRLRDIVFDWDIDASEDGQASSSNGC